MIGALPRLITSRSRRTLIGEWWRSVDQVTLSILVCLLGAGIILSMASSPAAAARLDYDNSFFFLYKHMIFVGMGMIGMFIVSLFDAVNARRIAVLTLIGSFLIMLALPFIGYEVKGAVRWVRIGGLGLQPSEFAKPAFIVFAAWMFSIRHRDPTVPSVAIVFAAYIALIGLLISQPDFGQSFLLTLGFAAVFFFAGLSLGWLLVMLGSAFLSPNTADSYQTDKALEAISSGGFFGQGPGEGRVKYSLPDGNTDFIFAVTVEEFGFLISTILILLLAAFVVQTFRNALRLNDYFCQLAAAGLATLVGMQTIINLYVNLNMAPSKGMTLPFISNGGSSMLALCFTAGLILAFTRRRPGAYEYGR